MILLLRRAWALLWGVVAAAHTVAPAERTVTVAAESRVSVVAAESRTYTVPAESRTYTVET